MARCVYLLSRTRMTDVANVYQMSDSYRFSSRILNRIRNLKSKSKWRNTNAQRPFAKLFLSARSRTHLLIVALETGGLSEREISKAKERLTSIMNDFYSASHSRAKSPNCSPSVYEQIAYQQCRPVHGWSMKGIRVSSSSVVDTGISQLTPPQWASPGSYRRYAVVRVPPSWLAYGQVD